MKKYLKILFIFFIIFNYNDVIAQSCQDTNNGVLNYFGNDCSMYSTQSDCNNNDDGIYYQGGVDYINEFGYTEFVAYEMCCACGGGTDYPYPYDCQDNETAINFYGGNLYH